MRRLLILTVLVVAAILVAPAYANNGLTPFNQCPDFHWFVSGKCALPESQGTDIELDISNKFRNDVDFQAYTKSNSVSEAASTAHSNARSSSKATGGNANATAGSVSNTSEYFNKIQDENVNTNSNTTGDINLAGLGQDNSVSTSSTVFEANPAYAAAGFATGIMADCFGLGGVDARGAGSRSSGGLTLNLFNKTNGRCLLDRKAQQAYLVGNMQLFAALTCGERVVWRAMRDVQSAFKGERVSKYSAIKGCITSFASLIAPTPAPEPVREFIKPSAETCGAFIHPHKPNKHGILIYEGKEYKATDREWPELQAKMKACN